MKHFIKAINKGDMGKIKNILSRDSTQIDIDEAIKYTKMKKMTSILDTQNTVTDEELDDIVKFLQDYKNASVLRPNVNKDIMTSVTQFLGGKKTRKSRKQKTKRNKTKKTKRTYKRKTRK